MEFPDLDELVWLEANQHEEEEYPVELELEEGKYGIEEEAYKSEEQEEEVPQQPQPQPQPQQQRLEIPSINSNNSSSNTKEKKRCRSEVEIIGDDDEIDSPRVRAKVSSVPVKDDDEKLVSRYASEINGECVPITGPAPSGSGRGERVYARLDQHKSALASKHNVPVLAPDTGLLSEPVSVLLHNAEQDAMLKALQASSQALNTLSPSLETSLVTEQLWVNKYAPRSFTELLSDEQTNREVLFWLKQWDLPVFGNGIKNTGDEVLSALRRHSSHSTANLLGKSRGRPRFAGNYTANSSQSDQQINRLKGHDSLQIKMQSAPGTPDPKLQVLLLCGPPGLGKTTLAHVAAKHCGYHVVEINASDDRSSSTIEAKILDVVQMNSVMSHSKPKCLVIDEIDGALGDGKGAVEVILKMVGKKSFVKHDTLDEQGRKLSNKGRKAMSLSRPVICICNDLYAPSLRPLRHVAKVHVFSQPTLNRVVNRLKYICNREGMKTSSTALTALAEFTGCDIRSCLNTLQFLHKKKESLNLISLSSQVIGRKDMARSIFDVWKEVFQKRKMKQSRKSDVNPKQTYDTNESLYSLVSNRGDYETIFDGIHENFLQLHYLDPVLMKTVHCLDALGVSDLLHKCVIHSHNMFLSAYHPFIMITIHQLLARVETPTIEWPKSFHRYRLGLVEKMDNLRSWQSRIAPFISRHLSINTFVEDTISPLLDILSPADLRPVAVHLLSEKEKHNLAQLVSTMASYSLTYRNVKSDSLAINPALNGKIDASSSLSLDPAISGFVNFKGYQPGHYELTSTVKQVLIYEVEKQKIVQESIGRSMHSTHSSKQDIYCAKDKQNGISESSKVQEDACGLYNKGTERIMSQKDSNKDVVSKSPGSGNSAAVMKLKSTGDVKKPMVASFNFFDRFKKLSREGCGSADSSEEKLAGPKSDERHLLFKFNEGFTNAVKRPVRMREFLM